MTTFLFMSRQSNRSGEECAELSAHLQGSGLDDIEVEWVLVFPKDEVNGFYFSPRVICPRRRRRAGLR